MLCEEFFELSVLSRLSISLDSESRLLRNSREQLEEMTSWACPLGLAGDSDNPVMVVKYQQRRWNGQPKTGNICLAVFVKVCGQYHV